MSSIPPTFSSARRKGSSGVGVFVSFRGRPQTPALYWDDLADYRSGAMTEMNSPAQLVARPPAKSELLFDADCYLCVKWAKRWQRLTGPAVVLRPLQDAESDYPELRGMLRTAIHLVEPNGKVTYAAQAILRSLAIGRKIHWPLRYYERCPFWRRLSDRFYATLAAHRCRTAPFRDA